MHMWRLPASDHSGERPRRHSATEAGTRITGVEICLIKALWEHARTRDRCAGVGGYAGPPPTVRRSSNRTVAPVRHHDRTGHIGREIGGEEDRRTDDILRLPGAPERRVI